jgi:DNA-directed RNA polymerase subunit RPC12/RpoP
MLKSKSGPFGEKIAYYCKDCAKFVEGQQVSRKYVFRCPICKTKNVAFGTEKSLKNFFHIDDSAEDEKVVKKEAEEKK